MHKWESPIKLLILVKRKTIRNLRSLWWRGGKVFIRATVAIVGCGHPWLVFPSLLNNEESL